MTPSTSTIRRLGQAGFLVASGQTCIAIDPFLSDFPGRLIPPVITPDELAQVDAILVTHEHVDHLDLPALAGMPEESSVVVIVPAPLESRVSAALPGRTVLAARVRETLLVGDVTVIPVPAMHGVHMSDAYGFGLDQEGDHAYLGYVVRLGGITIFHSGDSLDHPDLAATLRANGVDVALLPINGRDRVREAADIVGNMTATEAVDLAVRAGVAAVVPMHYDMFANNPGPLGAFVDEVCGAAPAVHVLIPGLSAPVHLPGQRAG